MGIEDDPSNKLDFHGVLSDGKALVTCSVQYYMFTSFSSTRKNILKLLIFRWWIFTSFHIFCLFSIDSKMVLYAASDIGYHRVPSRPNKKIMTKSVGRVNFFGDLAPSWRRQVKLPYTKFLWWKIAMWMSYFNLFDMNLTWIKCRWHIQESWWNSNDVWDTVIIL